MEPEVVAFEASWNSFDAAISAEESDIIAHLLSVQQSPYELDQDMSIAMPPMFWPDHSADLSYCSDFETNNNPYYLSQGTSSSSSSTSSFSLPLDNNGGCCFVSDSNDVPQISNSSTSMDFSIGEEKIIGRSLPAVSYHQFSEPVCATEETSSDEFRSTREKSSVPVPLHQTSQAMKKKFHAGDAEQPMTNEKGGTSIESPKKKARAWAPVPKKVKKAQSKKAKIVSSGNEEENSADLDVQNSSCCSSEEDSNASQELNGGGGASSNSKGGTLSPGGKRKTSRGSTNDPQSLYARRRRERINERLRLLQNLVPNGTKVDISTMLEEAVQYVKFLQLQIKLLSSDELWMYAPIAYNGINIGLDLKISPSQQ